MSPISLRHLPQVSGKISAKPTSPSVQPSDHTLPIASSSPHLQRSTFSNHVEIFSSLQDASSSKPSRFEFEIIPSDPIKTKPTVVQRISSEEMQKLSRMTYQERKERIKQILAKHLTEKQIRKKPTLLGIIQTESNFDPLAISSDGFESKGLFQLLDKTGLTIKRRINDPERYDPWNVEQNVKYGVSYFDYLNEIFKVETILGNGLKTIPVQNERELEKFAIAAFNAGEGRVATAQALAKKNGLNPSIFDNVARYLPKTTINYVQKVLATRENFVNSSHGTEVAYVSE